MSNKSLENVLDLAAFEKDFAAGKFDKLHKVKRKPKSQVKPKITYCEASECVRFLEKIICNNCKKEYKFFKYWGLKTYYVNRTTITRVSEANKKLFLTLKSQKKFGESIISEHFFPSCNLCEPENYENS